MPCILIHDQFTNQYGLLELNELKNWDKNILISFHILKFVVWNVDYFEETHKNNNKNTTDIP